MFKNLNLFQTANAMAVHAGRQQAIAATNIANADTPGYRAKRLASFSDTYQSNLSTHMRAQRAGHLEGNATLFSAGQHDASSYMDPNGNSVSLETEMLASVDAVRQHDRAIAIYRHGMTLLRTSLGKSS